MTFHRLLPLPALLLLAACGGAPPTPAVEGASGPAPSAAASAGAAPADEPAPAPGSRDPKIAALAKAALDCKFEEGEFDTECPAYKAWTEEEALFEDGHGDDTIFSMLGDPELKVRLLVADKDISAPYWESKEHAKTLVTLGKAEQNDNLSNRLGMHAAMVDWQTLGLAASLKDLAQHAPQPFRRALAYHLNSYFQTPAVIEVDQILIEDADKSVADTAVEGLGRGDTTEPLCKLLTAQMTRNDFRHSTALWAGSSASCAGMKELVAAELAKRIADPTKVTKDTGWDYVRAARNVCRGKSPELQSKGLALAKKLADARIPDTYTRRRSLDAIVECDPKAGAAFVGTLLKDKAIGKDAKTTLDELKKDELKKKAKK
jgi:hypothetical protein